MPSTFIPRKVEDFIFYYYAKFVIAPSAGFKGNYKFIIDTYKRLKSGEKNMSDYERELLYLAQRPDICSFCEASNVDVKPVQIVPNILGGPIGMHNLVNACSKCIESKKDKDLVKWWTQDLKRSQNSLPRVPIGLYLKIAYELHTIKFTLKKKCERLEDIFNVCLE